MSDTATQVVVGDDRYKSLNKTEKNVHSFWRQALAYTTAIELTHALQQIQRVTE